MGSERVGTSLVGRLGAGGFLGGKVEPVSLQDGL